MERSAFPSSSSAGLSPPPRGSGDPARRTSFENQKKQLIECLGVLGQQHFTSEARVNAFVRLLDDKGVPLTDHANVRLLFNDHVPAPAGARQSPRRALVEQLHQAVQANDGMAVRRLLYEEGVDPAQNRGGRNALTLALACKANVVAWEIYDWIADQIKASAPCDLLDRADGQGFTPLVLMIEAGDEEAIRRLLFHGASIDAPCQPPHEDHTPLMAAVCTGNGGMVEDLLLKQGADPLIVTPQGETALSLALKARNAALPRLLLKGMPKALEQAAQDIKDGKTGAAVRLARAAADLDRALAAAERSGHEDYLKLARPCHELAHRLLAQAGPLPLNVMETAAPPNANTAAGLQKMFAQEKAFVAKSPATIAKFISFVAARNVDPHDKDLVASLLPRFEAQLAAPKQAAGRALVKQLHQAVEANDEDEVWRLLGQGADPARIRVRRDRPANPERLQRLSRLASNYGSAPRDTRAAEFLQHGLQQALPSMAGRTGREAHPGRNALTLAIACKADRVVHTICAWVYGQRKAGKPCDLLDRPDGQGCTPLVMAVENDDVILSLIYGANVNLPCPRPNYAYTPLMAAVLKENEGWMRRLLKKGANPLIVTPQGDSALSLAMKTEDAAVLKRLLKALPRHLEQAVLDIKEGKTGASESAVRLARAVTDLDEVMALAARSGDMELLNLARSCHEQAHRLQPKSDLPKLLSPDIKLDKQIPKGAPQTVRNSDELETLFHFIKEYKQDPKNAPTGLLIYLDKAPWAWKDRVKRTRDALNEGPIHSEQIERFYAELLDLARIAGPVNPDLGRRAEKCIAKSFSRYSEDLNVHDGAKFLDLLLRDAKLHKRHSNMTAWGCVWRIEFGAKRLVNDPKRNFGGTQFVASLVRAQLALGSLCERTKGMPYPYTDKVYTPLFEKANSSGAFQRYAIQHLSRVSSQGSAPLAAGMFVDAFRICAAAIEESSAAGRARPDATVIALFSALGPRGQHHALKQLSQTEFSSLSAIIKEDDSRSFFGHTPAFKAVQEFKQGRRYTPPLDRALYKDIGKQIDNINTQYAKPELRGEAVGTAITSRIRQFIGGAGKEPLLSLNLHSWLAEREATAEAFVEALSALDPQERSATLLSLATSELLIVRSWFEGENDMRRQIDSAIAERAAKGQDG